MRTRLGIALVVALVLAGVLLVVLGDEPDDPPADEPTATAATLCKSEVTTTFDVATPDQDGDTVPAPTSLEAAEPWTDGKDELTETGAGQDVFVTVARSDDVPQVVLRVSKGESGWSVDETTACLSLTGASEACPQDAVDFHLRRYERAEDAASAEPGPAYGQIDQRSCIEVDGHGAVPRGPVRPITAFGSGGQDAKAAVVIVQDGEPHRYDASR